MREDRRAPPDKAEEAVEERGYLCDRKVQWPEIAAIVSGGIEKQLRSENAVGSRLKKGFYKALTTVVMAQNKGLFKQYTKMKLLEWVWPLLGLLLHSLSFSLRLRTAPFVNWHKPQTESPIKYKAQFIQQKLLSFTIYIHIYIYMLY